MEDEMPDWMLPWTMTDLSDPAAKKATVIVEKLGISIDQFISEAIAEKVARWESEHSDD